jgi:membrane protease YdiL (CAAX protease family)
MWLAVVIGCGARDESDTAKTGSTSFTRVVGPAIVVVVPLVAAAWLPSGFPHMLRQVLLCIWGVGAILVAERLLFSNTLQESLRAVGFVWARKSRLEVVLLASLPMWAFLPIFAWTNGTAVELRPEWLSLLFGVVLVNGVTEEVIHRGFVFGHLRRGRSFATAARISAMLFAAQHLYIVVTMGWTIGLASVLLAALLAYPMASVFARGGHSILGPAILHTSSNAPVMILRLPEDFMTTALLPHMAVIIVSLYLLFIVQQVVVEKRRPATFAPSCGRDCFVSLELSLSAPRSSLPEPTAANSLDRGSD